MSGRAAGLNEKLPEKQPFLAPKRLPGLPGRIAEFLLVVRLRARRRTELCSDMLQHAVHMVLVTCKSWFLNSSHNKQGPA